MNAMSLWLTMSAVLLAVAEGDVRFGNLQIDEPSVAFVVDGSRWTKNKQIELNEELVRTVAGMPADRQFAVIFFADDKLTSFAGGKLVPATDDNKDKLRAWLEDVELGDDPRPIPALTRAFELKPAAVVFITDGHFDDYDGVESHAASLNKDAKVRVHTVGFFKSVAQDDSRKFVEFMRRLAERNGGRSVVVYADELKKR